VRPLFREIIPVGLSGAKIMLISTTVQTIKQIHHVFDTLLRGSLMDSVTHVLGHTNLSSSLLKYVKRILQYEYMR